MSNTGILTMPAEQYHAAEGVSKSMLDYLADPYTPAHFWSKFIGKEIENEETDAMRMGTLVHRVILEPDTLDGAFHIRPDGMKFTTKDGIAWRDTHQDLPILTSDQAKASKCMRDAVWRHPVASKILKGAKTEQNLFAEDSSGTLRKCRMDILCDGNAVPDLKTVDSASPDKFERSLWEYRYFVQLPYYASIANLLGMDKQCGVFICVEKSPPYDVVVYELDELAWNAGRMSFERDLALYRNCLESGRWPGRSGGVETISLPAWAAKRMEQEQVG